MTDFEHLTALENASANPRDAIAAFACYAASIYSLAKYL